ncbi:MAG: hypothetical protein H0T78_12315 [Longispora sp.]|nr:hypothetical protein [Longispora sp. (in: high G+C Gram-positive bacteria)]
MRRALIALAVLLAIVLPGSGRAEAAPRWSIEIVGTTNWPTEFAEVLESLRMTYGIPISYNNACVATQPCIHFYHYQAADGLGGFVTGWPGRRGSSELAVNDTYDRGHSYRLEVLYHEFGHALGLVQHSPACQSSMQPTVGMCGSYMMGYTPTEQQRLRAIWG